MPRSASRRCRGSRRCRRRRWRNSRKSVAASRRRSSSARRRKPPAASAKQAAPRSKPRSRHCQAEIAATKAANQAAADPHDYREAETRDLFIDLLLREAGLRPECARHHRGPRHRHAECPRRGFRRLCAARRRRQAARARRGQAHPQGPARRPAAGQALCRLSGDGNTASGRSSSTPTATITGFGTTAAIRRGRSRAF